MAFASSTVVNITSKDYRIPVLTGDPDTVWTPEGQEITPDEANFDEVNVTPLKVAGLTVISRELAADSTPEAEKVISTRLVQSLRRKIDVAWFANTTANGPSGLGSITPTLVYGGTSFVDTDPFLEAVAEAELEGARLTAFVAHPSTVLALSQLKELPNADSNKPLLSDASAPGGRTIAGVPLVSSPDAPNDGTVWGIPKARVFVIVRQDAEVAVDRSAFFTSDRVAVRVVLRVGFGFPHEAAVVHILDSDPS